MIIQWSMDKKNFSIDAGLFTTLGDVLKKIQPKIYYYIQKDFVTFDNKLFDVDHLPLFQIKNKEMYSSFRFFESDHGKKLLHRYLQQNGKVCPVCTQQRLFLLYHGLKIFQAKDVMSLTKIIGWVPCFCHQEEDLIVFISRYASEKNE